MPAARDRVEGRWHLRRDNKNVYRPENHAITIIIIYPPNLENIFIICLQLGYSIYLHGYADTNHLAKKDGSSPCDQTTQISSKYHVSQLSSVLVPFLFLVLLSGIYCLHTLV